MITALALMAVMSVAPAHAQDLQVVAHIPFAFRVGTSTLPAGDYTLERQGQSQHYWLIRNDWVHTGVFALASIGGTNEEWDSASLVFHRSGDTYFLSQIRCRGETYEMPISKTELETMARSDAKPESLYVLTSLRQAQLERR